METNRTSRLNDTGSRRLSVSTIRGVGDSQTQQYWESTTLRVTDTRSRRLPASPIRRVGIEFFKRRLAVSVIRRVVNSAYRWYGDALTPRIVESGSRLLRLWLIRRRRLPVSLSRGVDDSAYRWYGESLVEKKNSLASIFSTLNGWRWPLKDQFGQKLARDVIYYQSRII
jgi:hypothetical protein